MGVPGWNFTASSSSDNKECIINAASFNLRMDTPYDGENAWSNQKKMVKNQIRFYDFEIFGTQEGLKKMLDVNFHFDHEGDVARKESAKLLVAKIKEIAGDNPVFASGDYNARPESEPIQVILSEGLLNDVYLLSEQPPYGTEGTFQGFRPNAEMKNRIDYIFVTHGIRIKKYGTLNEMPYGKFPSDHFPIIVFAEF